MFPGETRGQRRMLINGHGDGQRKENMGAYRKRKGWKQRGCTQNGTESGVAKETKCMGLSNMVVCWSNVGSRTKEQKQTSLHVQNDCRNLQVRQQDIVIHRPNSPAHSNQGACSLQEAPVHLRAGAVRRLCIQSTLHPANHTVSSDALLIH